MTSLRQLQEQHWRDSQKITILSALTVAMKKTQAQVHLSVLGVIGLEASQNLLNDMVGILEELQINTHQVSITDDPLSRFDTVFEVHVLINLGTQATRDHVARLLQG